MKTLIAYFSNSGNTAKVAKELQKLVGGDLFEIRGTKDYGSYVHALGVARREFKNNELPKVVLQPKEIETYDRVLVGFPVWYSKCPQIVMSFLNSEDLKGKDIYPFCTSGASGPEGPMAQMTKAYPDLNWHEAIRFKNVEKSAVESWLGTI